VSQISHIASTTPDAPTRDIASAIGQRAFPPGCFVTEELAADCARFLDDARGRAIARADAAQQDPRFHGP
jgi:hypothetical protein